MLRWIAALSAALLLSGCVTTREYVYTNDPARAGYRERVYDDGSYAEGDRYYSDGTYYSSSAGSSGDYYYREPGYYGSSYYSSSWYFDYPAYYSIFHPINSWWYDPYYYPNYYYGVTYFPRNYLSISFGYPHGYGWPHRSYVSYSPYRYSWVDNYYDWEPWYRNYPRYRDYYPTPRYGSARREAERLASWSDSRRYYGQGAGLARDGRYNAPRRNDPTAGYGNARNGQRGADYGSRTAPRQDPGVRGFGVPTDVRRNGSARDGSVRGANDGNSSTTRQIPSRGFGVAPAETPRSNAGTNNGVPRRGADYGAAREVERVGDVRRTGGDRATGGAAPAPSQPPRSYSTDTPVVRRDVDSDRANADRRGYELPSSAPRRYASPANSGSGDTVTRQVPQREVRSHDDGTRGYSIPAAQPRQYEAPAAQQQAPRGYSQSAPRSYSAPAPAPAPNYSAPAPAPQREAYSAPPRESYSAPSRESSRGSDNGSSRGDSGGVRRVGSNRDDR